MQAKEKLLIYIVQIGIRLKRKNVHLYNKYHMIYIHRMIFIIICKLTLVCIIIIGTKYSYANVLSLLYNYNNYTMEIVISYENEILCGFCTILKIIAYKLMCAKFQNVLLH